MTNALTVQQYINNDSVQVRISRLLDKRASQFTTSLITAVNANERLAKCKPETVLNAALTAASMNLPINQNLGFAALVPYGNECQFQMMVKGFIQLAQRSGRYRTISASAVYEGQLTSNDPLRGITFDWSVTPKEDAEPIGYVAYFELLNGFEKTLYMSLEEVTAHGKRYSKTFKNGPWQDNFEAMALKTVLKLLISRFGPMSTEMETAIESDQAVITDTGRKYVDHDDMDGVKADDDKKQSIIDANTQDDDDEVPEGELSDEQLAANMDETTGNAKPSQQELTDKAKKRYGSANKNT